MRRRIHAPKDTAQMMVRDKSILVCMVMEIEPVPLFGRIFPSYVETDHILACFLIINMEYFNEVECNIEMRKDLEDDLLKDIEQRNINVIKCEYIGSKLVKLYN